MAVGTTDFPGALDSKNTLVWAANQASSTLSTTINSTDTSIVLASGTAFPASGIILIDSELIAYSSKATNTLTVQTSPTGRGYESTTAASHTSGATVRLIISAISHNVQSDAIIATQTKVGTGSSTPTANVVLTGTGTGTSAWATISNAFVASNAAINLSKLENIATSRLLGRATASSGAIEQLTVGGSLYFTTSPSPSLIGQTYDPGGNDTNVQYNNAGVNGGSDDFVFTTDTSSQVVRLRTNSATATVNPQIQFRRARGTGASPTATQSGDAIGTAVFQGYNGAAYLEGASIQAAATAAWTSSPSVRSSRLIFTVWSGASSYPYNLRFDRFVPPSDNTSSLGESGTAWSTLHTRSVTLAGSTSGTTVLQAAATAAGTYTWPGSDGTSGQVLSTNGSGVLSWATVSGGSGSPGGSTTQLQYNNAGAFGGISGATSNGTNVTFGSGNLLATSPQITTSLTTDSATFALLNTTATTINFGGAATTLNMAGGSGAAINLGGGVNAAELRFLEPSGSGTNYTALKAQAQAANVTYTLPAADGTSGQVLSTNGSGTLSWATASGGGGSPGGSSGQVQFNSAGSFGGATGFTYQSGASPNVTITAQNAGYVALSLVSASTPTIDVFRVSADNGTTTHFRITSTGSPSSPDTGSNSERYGAGAICLEANSVSIGNGAYCRKPRSVVIGRNATTNTSVPDASFSEVVIIGDSASLVTAASGVGRSVVVGSSASSDVYGVAVGYAASAAASAVGIGRNASTGSHSVGIGMVVSATHAGAVALGPYATTTSTNQFVCGSDSYPTSNTYFGKGVTNASPTTATINGTGGSGTNIAGANIDLAAGRGTGTGIPGTIGMQFARAGTTGSSLNALSDEWRMDYSTTDTVRIRARVRTSTTSLTDAAAMTAVWTTATHASRTSALDFWDVYNGGSLAQAARITEGRFSIMSAADANPTTTELASLAAASVYVRGSKFVISYNNAGTITYITIPLDGSTTTWTHSTTAP